MASVSTCLRSPSGLRPPLRLLESLTLASTDQGRDSLRVSWDLPNGLHFQKLALAWRSKEDLRWVTGLIVRCSDTLEYLDVSRYSQGTFALALWCSYDLLSFVAGSGPTSIDLSKASKLRDVVFWPMSPTVTWIVTALETVAPKHRDLRQILIHIPFDLFFINAYARDSVRRIIGEAAFKELLGLDDLLVRLWESRSVRPKVTLHTSMKEVKQGVKYCIGYLIPETTKRGIINLVERCVPQT